MYSVRISGYEVKARASLTGRGRSAGSANATERLLGEIRPLPAITGFCNRPNSDADELSKSYINLRAGPRLLLDRFSLGFARIALVENVQKGLHSISYNRGRFFVDSARSYYSELAVHHLHGLVFQHLRPFIPDSVNI